jgi:aspartokinase/homoserine dehydrogenase 1
MREIGIKINLEDVKIEKLISSEAENASSTDEFLKLLADDDAKFNKMKEEALAEGKTLCYIAKYEKGEASLSIQKIDKSHPFSNLHGSDNIVTFTTKRYSVRPLTIQGPGAGAEITASGILSDILRIANSIN